MTTNKEWQDAMRRPYDERDLWGAEASARYDDGQYEAALAAAVMFLAHTLNVCPV